MRFVTLLTTALAVAVAAPAQARPLTVPATASWKHADNEVVLPPQLAGMSRGEMSDSGESELDVSVQYGAGTKSWLTIYVFKPALRSLPVWFDRSETKILGRDGYHGPSTTGPIRGVIPPGASAASGLRRMYVPAAGNIKATGLAMVPVGEWLVAFRISSAELSAPELDEKLTAAITQVRWPNSIAAAPVALPVQPCADKLAYDKRAKTKKPDMSSALLASALAFAVSDNASPKKNDESEKLPPPVWCREESQLSYGVYRPSGQANTYTMAIEDAGVVVTVAPALALDEKSAGYQVSLQELDRTLIYPSFNKLPLPEKAFEAVRKGTPMSSVQGGNNITIGVE
jgi:hypothetical protein